MSRNNYCQENTLTTRLMVSNAELIIPHYWESLSKSDFEMGMNL